MHSKCSQKPIFKPYVRSAGDQRKVASKYAVDGMLCQKKRTESAVEEMGRRNIKLRLSWSIRSSCRLLALRFFILTVIVFTGVAGKHANFSCYVCDSADDPSCCAQPLLVHEPSDVFLFEVHDFLPTCVTLRVQGVITARFPKELPLTKLSLKDGCQSYQAAGQEIEICYCSQPGCNSDIDCTPYTTTDSPATTTESITDGTGQTDTTNTDITTVTPSTPPPPALVCPERKGVSIGGKQYDLVSTLAAESLKTKCKTEWPASTNDPLREGYAVWSCDQSGHWELDTPDLSGCWTVDYNSLRTAISTAKEPASVIQVIGDLTKILRTTGDVTVGGDLTRGVGLATAALQKLQSMMMMGIFDADVALNALDAFLGLSDELAAMETGWRTCGGHYAANFLMTTLLEQPFRAASLAMAGMKAEDLAENPIVFDDMDYLKMELSATKMTGPVGPRIASGGFSYMDSSIWLHLGLHEADSSMTEHVRPLRLAAVGYKNMHEHFKSPFAGSTSSAPDWTPTSRIHGLKVQPDDESGVPDGSHVSFQAANLCPLKSKEFEDRTPVCFGLQNTQQNRLGPNNWSVDYCTLDGFDEIHTRCRCDSTVFMMIVAVEKAEGDELLCKTTTGDKTFSDIVLPGYVIAATCFLLALLVFLIKRPRSCGPLVLTRSNFAFSNVVMFFALIGAVKMDPASDLHACNLFGGIALFGLFASLGWLAVDAMCVKQLLSGQTKDSGLIAGRRKSRKIVLPLICYGLPIVFVSITALSTSWVDFRNEGYCFINLDTSSVWALVVFALSALAVAFSALVSAVAKLHKARSWDCGDLGNSEANNAYANDDEYYGAPDAFTVKKSLFECFIFAVLTTSSWICGLIYFSEGYESAAVGFAVFNSFLGIFAVIAYVTSAFRKSSGGRSQNRHMFPPGTGPRRHQHQQQQQQRHLSFIDVEMRNFPSIASSSPSIRHRQQQQPQRSSAAYLGDVEAESAI